MLLILASGPAIKGVCVAEGMEVGAVLCHWGRILVPTRMNEAWRTFCQSGYKVIWGLRVSRYKVYGEQVTSQGTQSFIAGTGEPAPTELKLKPDW